MPITYLDEEEEDFASPLRPTPLTQPRRKITYLDEEPAGQQVGLLPPIEEMFKPKPKEVGTFEGIANAARNAFASSQQALAVTGGVTPEEAQEISKIEYEKNARQVSPDYKAYQEAEGFEAVKAFAANPIEVTTNIVAEGLAGSLPSLGAGLAAGGVGAVVGSAVPVVGTATGFLGGQVAGTFAGSLATEYGSKVLEELQNEGMNISDPNSITEFFSNQQLVDKAKDKALKRGVPVAAFDSISAGIGGKVGKILGTAFKTKPREAAAEMAVQAALGGGGEVAGSLVAGDKIDPKAVFAEVVGEVGPGAAEISVGKIQQSLVERRKQEQIKRAAQTAENLENNDAPLTANALKTTVAKNVIAEEKATIEETDAVLAEEASKFAPPAEAITREELKTQYATLSDKELVEAESTFREDLESEDAETRSFAQNALNAIAEVKAEKAPVRKTELPTDVLPTETPAATYGREAEIYDVFAGVRQRPLPPSGPAFESAQVIEQELARAERLRQSPEGRAQLRSELQGEQMTGEVRRAVERALATTPEVVEEGDVFAEVRRPTEVAPAEPVAPVEPTPVAPAEVETAASLSRVADNTATDEEVVRLARQGLVNIQDGQNVITPRGEEVMQRGGAPLPKLTPEERAAEVAAAPAAIVEQAPTPTQAPTPVTTPPVTEAVTPAPAAPAEAAPEVAPAPAVTEQQKIEAESPLTTELRNKIKQTKGQDRRAVIQLAINDRSFFPAAIDAAEVGKPLPSIEKAFVPNDVELPDRIDTTRIKLPAIKSKSPEESASQMISYDDKRWVLGGVYFDSTNNMIVATDGRALVAIPQKITGGDKIVAARNIKETTYQKAIKKGQRIDGNYPNWKATIPTYGKDIQKVDIDIDDARRASTILESINNTFSNKIGDSVIVFNNARFNPKYILSSINALLESGAKSITAQIRSEADPLLLTGDNGAIAVVMPMRVTGRIAHQLKSKTETRPPVKKYNTQALLNAAKPFSEYGSNYNRNIAASYERLKNAIDKGLSESTTSSIAEELEIRLNKFQPEALTSPTPAVPVAEPAGISVGNRVKTKTTPQSFVVEEVLPQSAREAELGEQYYSIRNERTGEVQTVESNDIRVVRGKGMRKLFAGEKAEMPQFRRDSLDAARAMAATGKTPEEIRAVTGWFPGKYDKKMRWEIPDQNVQLNRNWKEAKTIGELITHDELFRAYPEIANIKFEFRPGLAAGVTENADLLVLPSGLKGLTVTETTLAGILHEIQHLIQYREGFERGGNEAAIYKKEEAAIQAKKKRLENKREEARLNWEKTKDEKYLKEWQDAIDAVWDVMGEKPPKRPYEEEFAYYKRLAGEIESRDIEARMRLTDEQRAAIEPYSSENISPEEANIMQQDVAPTPVEVISEQEIRVEEKVSPVPEADRYTFEEAGIRAIEFFNGKAPDGLVIVNDSTNPDYKFKAGYDPETGDIIINRAFIRKGESIEDILSHELGHYIFSDPKFQAAFQRFWNEMSDVEKANADKIINQFYNKQSGAVQMEEKKVRAFMALVEEARLLPRWKQILNAIKQWLNDKFKTNFNVTDRGALSVLAVAHKRFRKGEVIVREMNEGVLRMATEPTPAPEAVAEEALAERPKRKTKIQSIIEATTGVKRPISRITVNEMTALKEKIKDRARRRREDKRSQREFADALMSDIKALTMRGKVRPTQLRSITSKALRTQFDNDKSVQNFIKYFNKVIENANYEADLKSARDAQKSASVYKKRKNIPDNQREILDRISKANVGLIDDPLEFATAAREYMKAFVPATSKEYGVIPDSDMHSYLDEIQEEIDSEQERIQNETIKSAFEKVEKDEKLTRAEMKAYMGEENYTKYLEEQSEKRREKIEKAINTMANESKENLINYEPVDFTEEQMRIVKFLRKADIEGMSPDQKREYIQFVDSIVANNVTYGAGKVAATVESIANVNRWIKDKPNAAKGRAAFETLERIKTGLSTFGRSVPDIFREIFKKGSALGQIQQRMGIYDLTRGQVNANKMIDEIERQYEEFYKENNKKYPESMERDGLLAEGIVSYLIQREPQTDDAQSVKDRARKLQTAIDRWKENPKTRDYGNAAQAVFDKVMADSSDGILDKLKEQFNGNYKSLVWMRDVLLPKYRPMLKEFDENFQNQSSNYDESNYLPISYIKKFVSAERLNETNAAYDNRTFKVTQIASSIKRKKMENIPKDMDLDLNIRRGVFNNLAESISKSQTAPAWQRIISFLDAENADKVFGTEENKQMVLNILTGLKTSRERKAYLFDGADQLVDTITSGARSVASSLALGGFTQPIKQMPEQLFSTAMNVNPFALGKNLMPKAQKDATPLLDKFSIGQRADITAGTKFINQAESAYNRAEKYMESSKWLEAKDAIGKANRLWMTPLTGSDVYAARAAWMSYYQQYLQREKIPFLGWEKEGQLVDTDPQRQAAATYAESITDIYQGASDPTRMALFAQRGRNAAENVLKAIFFNFNSFSVQQKSRFFSDARDLVSKTTDFEDKISAARGLTATIGGIVLFNLVRAYVISAISNAGVSLVYAMLGVDQDEPDEEQKKKDAEFKWKKFISGTMSNFFMGGAGQFAEEGFIDALNTASYWVESNLQTENVLNKDGSIMSYKTYERTNAPFWRYKAASTAPVPLGLFEIPLGQVEKLHDIVVNTLDEDKYENLTEEEKRIISFNSLVQFLYVTRIFGDVDVSRIVEKTVKDVEKQAKEREESQRKLMRMFQ